MRDAIWHLGSLRMPLYALRMNLGYPHPVLTFEEWKSRLGADCQRMHKLLIVENSGDYETPGEDALAMLWISGLEPTLQAIIDEGDTVERPSTDA